MRHCTAAALLARVQIWRVAPDRETSQSLITSILAGALLSACSAATPPVVTTQGGHLATGQTVALVQPPDDARMAALHAALIEAFQSRGFSVVGDAEHRIEYSVTERPSSVGIAHEGIAGAKSEPVIVSVDRHDRRIFRECNAKRLRIVLVAYPKQSDDTIKRAAGEMDDCGFTAESVDALVMATIEQFASN